MQDNTDNINNEFVDESWAQMQSLLDEHLPVSEDPKDWKFTLLAGLSLFLLMSSIGLLHLYVTNPQIKEVIVEKVIYKPEYIQIKTTTSEKTSQVAQTGNAHEKSGFDSDSFHKTIEHHMGASTVTETTENYTSIDNTRNASISTLKNLAPIQCLAPQLDYQTESGLGFEKVEEINVPQKKNKPIQFELGVLVSATADKQFAGVGLSSGIKFPLTKRLALNTGLGINSFDGDRFLIGASTQKAENISEFYYKGLRKFNQIFLPLSLDYSITKSLAINSGVRLRYTYSEELDSSLPNLASGPSRRAADENVSLYNNTNLGFSAGLKYTLNPRWNILLDSEWGVTNLLNRTQFFASSSLEYELNVINLRTSFTF